MRRFRRTAVSFWSGRALGIVVATAEEIEVAGRPIDLAGPHEKEHGALHEKVPAVARHAEPMEQALHGIARQHELEIVTARGGTLEETRPNGRGAFDLMLLDARTESPARHAHDFDLAPAGLRGAGLRIDREPQRWRRLRGEPLEPQRGE